MLRRYGRKVVPRVNLAQSKSKGSRSGSDADAGGEGVEELGREGEGSKGESHDAEKRVKKRTNRWVIVMTFGFCRQYHVLRLFVCLQE